MVSFDKITEDVLVEVVMLATPGSSSPVIVLLLFRAAAAAVLLILPLLLTCLARNGVVVSAGAAQETRRLQNGSEQVLFEVCKLAKFEEQRHQVVHEDRINNKGCSVASKERLRNLPHMVQGDVVNQHSVIVPTLCLRMNKRICLKKMMRLKILCRSGNVGGRNG